MAMTSTVKNSDSAADEAETAASNHLSSDEATALATAQRQRSGSGVSDEAAAEAAEPPSHPSSNSKKRRADVQLNKDDQSEGRSCGSDDADINEKGGRRSDPFKRASEDVLKKRRIVKASIKWSANRPASAGDGGGAFTSVKIANTVMPANNPVQIDAPPREGSSTVFGSSPGVIGSGFGAVPGGFGALNPPKSDNGGSGPVTTVSSGFGSGSEAVSLGFGSLKPSLFGFTSVPMAKAAPVVDSNSSGLTGSFPENLHESLSAAAASKFPTSSAVNTANGEQDEDCLCQVRAKLFKMVQEECAPVDADNGATALTKSDMPSVPSSSGRINLAKGKEEGQAGSPKKEDIEPSQKREVPCKVGDEDKTQKMVQKEAGIGPVRVLRGKKCPKGEKLSADRSANARVVQRQETSGGQATRVILNVRLVPGTCGVVRRGERYVQLNSPGGSAGGVDMSLFKVKSSADADLLEVTLNEVLEVVVAGGCSDKK